MRSLEFRASQGRIAMTAYLPDKGALSGCVVFASPGGGYSRGYYDMSFAGHEGYSQAAHHTARGHVVIAYDHLGVGDSRTDENASISIEDIADVNHQAVAETQARIREGRLSPDLPALPNAFHVGIGQSMGGGVTVIMQGRHRTFDAIGVLGYSAIHTLLPQRAESDRQALATLSRRTDPADLSVEAFSATVTDFLYPFHWEDVPTDLVEVDMGGGYPARHTAPPFGSLTIPNCVLGMMAPGFVREAAARVDVPVFLAFGERDVSADPHAEPSAFPAANDISLLVIPRMAHMHNFAGTRRLLWDRLGAWAADQAASKLH